MCGDAYQPHGRANGSVGDTKLLPLVGAEHWLHSSKPVHASDGQTINKNHASFVRVHWSDSPVPATLGMARNKQIDRGGTARQERIAIAVCWASVYASPLTKSKISRDMEIVSAQDRVGWTTAFQRLVIYQEIIRASVTGFIAVTHNCFTNKRCVFKPAPFLYSETHQKRVDKNALGMSASAVHDRAHSSSSRARCALTNSSRRSAVASVTPHDTITRCVVSEQRQAPFHAAPATPSNSSPCALSHVDAAAASHHNSWSAFMRAPRSAASTCSTKLQASANENARRSTSHSRRRAR